MKIQNRNKLNQMLRHWPANGLRTTASLREQGISNALLHQYVKRQWLEQVERGVYRRPGDRPGWRTALNTVQQEMGLPVHVGGLTALDLQGYGHYMGVRPLFLFGPPGTRLPAWFEGTIGRAVYFGSTHFLQNAPEESVHTMVMEGFPVTLSTPERAALELLYHVPRRAGFSEVLEVIGGLLGMRVSLLQALLEGCTSVKVKRLFLYCARESGHSWYAALDRSRIDLGSGKREIVKGGNLDKEFLITVVHDPYAVESEF